MQQTRSGQFVKKGAKEFNVIIDAGVAILANPKLVGGERVPQCGVMILARVPYKAHAVCKEYACLQPHRPT